MVTSTNLVLTPTGAICTENGGGGQLGRPYAMEYNENDQSQSLFGDFSPIS